MDWLSQQYNECIEEIFDLEELKADDDLGVESQIVVQLYREVELKHLKAKARHYDGLREDLRMGKLPDGINYKAIEEQTGDMDSGE